MSERSLTTRWVEQALGAPLPGEPVATCEDCTMLEGAPSCGEFFNAATKCCTYVPRLPNYSVGGILEEEGAEWSHGRSVVRRRIEEAVGASPLGLGPTPTERLIYREAAPLAFGKSSRLQCPYFVAGGCSIWPHRDATCRSWFCKHARGAVGQAFWDAVYRLVRDIERVLSAWCLLELGVSEEVLARVSPAAATMHRRSLMTAAEVDGRRDPAVDQNLWGEWCGRAEELFVHCHDRVRSLVWNDLLCIGGTDLRLAGRLLAAAHQRLLSLENPPNLRFDGIEITSSGGTVRARSYSSYDGLELPPELLAALLYFDGRPTAEALRRIEGELGVELGPDLLRMLCDFNILVSESPD